MEVTQGAPFESFGLSEATMRAVRNKHYAISTPVQAGCIPPMLAGKDVIAKAPTGTGKTMAFGIPIIERIDPESEAVQAVILAPTRELAMQITDEMRDIAVCHEGVRLVCLYGGQPIGKQIDALKRRPQIVVATPGRLSDHMKRRTVRVDTAQTVVLDGGKISALARLDMRPAGWITQQFERDGYTVASVHKGETIAAHVDLADLWQQTAAQIERDRLEAQLNSEETEVEA